MKEMKKLFLAIFIFALALAGIIFFSPLYPFQKENQTNAVVSPAAQAVQEKVINLPRPKLKGGISLEEAISKRRSRRNYQDKSLSLEQVSQILWAGQGITDEKTGFRSAPSAGALYPLDIYLIVGESGLPAGRQGVEGLESGVYHFVPQGHKIEEILAGDLKEEVMRASLNQTFIAQAPVVLIITGEYERTTKKYGDRGKQYVHMEAGHAAQNIYLQVESLGLGAVTVGAFDGEEIIKILNLPKSHKPLYVMPIGHSK